MTAIEIVKAEPGDAAAKFLARRRYDNLIGGKWCSSNSGETFATLDPATGEEIGQLPRSGESDVDMAVAAARTAFKDGRWTGLTPMERSRLLWRIADLIEENIDELAELETLDQGKALYVGRWGEIPGAVAQFRYFSGVANSIEGTTIPTSINYQPEGKRVFAYTQKVPVGVVGAIVPWNSPLVLTAMKIAPALAAGCCIIVKPAENTSLTAVRLFELIVDAGVPEGVVNLVHGLGPEAGDALAKHEGVDKIVFTGSTATGRKIVEASKGNLKRVQLELGGKSPVIIMEDADLEAAIEGAANAIFFNGGQVCVAGSRLYCHSSVFDKVIEGVAQIAKGIKLGHGLALDTQMGPLVSREHSAKVASFIESGKRDGASVLCGGETAGPNESFITPTVLTGVRPEMEIVREEVFGPVLVASRFDDAEEVIAAANDSQYGLAAGVWTESLSNGLRMAEAIEAGTVWINSHAMYDASLPIGGMKQSGWGRDSGHAAVESYLEVKSVCAIY